jgi:hypothetical protein
MLIKIYSYLKKYKDDKIKVTKNSVLFQRYITVYNDAIHKLIIMLYNMKYTSKPIQSNIQFNEECIYY